MPVRTNEFQRLMGYIYKNVAPTGAKVTESALLREDGTGAEREVDILIEHEIAGVAIRMAIECRDWSKGQDIVWIDGLIGKYVRLKVDKKVAVASKRFSRSAQDKAERNGIECLTVQKASKVDWAARLHSGSWTSLRYENLLYSVRAFSTNDREVSSTVIDENNMAQHKDAMSEGLYPQFVSYFEQKIRSTVERTIRNLIQPNWHLHVLDPRGRHGEFTAETHGSMVSMLGELIPIEKLVFGVKTLFTTYQTPIESIVVGKYMHSQVPVGNFGGVDLSVRFIAAEGEGVIHAAVGNWTVDPPNKKKSHSMKSG